MKMMFKLVLKCLNEMGQNNTSNPLYAYNGATPNNIGNIMEQVIYAYEVVGDWKKSSIMFEKLIEISKKNKSSYLNNIILSYMATYQKRTKLPPSILYSMHLEIWIKIRKEKNNLTLIQIILKMKIQEI